MIWGRLLLLAVLAIATVVACNSAPKVPVSTAALKKAYWGRPVRRAPPPTSPAWSPAPTAIPCDVFANAANYDQPKLDLNNRLTVIWTCQPQRFVLSEVVAAGLKVRMACVGGQPLVPRTHQILEATWGSARRPDDRRHPAGARHLRRQLVALPGAGDGLHLRHARPRRHQDARASASPATARRRRASRRRRTASPTCAASGPTTSATDERRRTGRSAGSARRAAAALRRHSPCRMPP